MLTLEEYRCFAQLVRDQRNGDTDVDKLADCVVALSDEIERLRRETEDLRDCCTVAYRRANQARRELVMYEIATQALADDERQHLGVELGRARQATELAPVEKPSGEIERR